MPDILIDDIREKVAMVYSMPRTTWTANMRCAVDVASLLGVPMREYGSAYWSLSLEIELAKLLDSKYEYALTVDYDTVFQPNNVLHLYALMKGNPGFDAIAAIQAKRCSPAILLARKDADGKIPATIDGGELSGEVFKASQAHFGLTMIRLSALRDIPRPWFLRVPNPDKPGESIDDDIYFWHQWEKAGKSLYVDCYNCVGHMELFVTWIGQDTKPIYQPWDHFVRHGRAKGARGIDRFVNGVV